MNQITEWKCPVCGHNAYQKYGGVPVPATKVIDDFIRRPTTVNMGSHFMCKGCSVHFSNPYRFNRFRIQPKDQQ